MSAHTPGPWAVSPIHDQGFYGNNGEMIVTSEEQRICAVNCVAPFKRGNGYLARCEERDANARLIAAAPELLEALKTFVSKYVSFIESGDAGSWDAEKEPKVIAARAAIAKAEGAS